MPVSVARHVAGYPTEGRRRSRSGSIPVSFHLPVPGIVGVVAVRKRYDFCLDARTVTWADALDLSVIQRGVGETFAQDCMTGFVGERCPQLSCFKTRCEVSI